MIVAAHKNLEDFILELLTSRQETSVKDIQVFIGKHGQTATEQGLYRILRKLQKKGVIVKHKKYYSLRLAWLLQLSQLVDKMEETYLKESYLQRLLPQNNKQVSWHFSDLFKMTNFWSQLLLAIAKQSSSKVAFNYSPHLWFVPLQEEPEEQFMNTYFHELKKSYMIIGSKSSFDKHTLSVMDSIDKGKREERYMTNSPSEQMSKSSSEYIDIIDDYILTVKLDGPASKKIEEICQNATPLHPDELFQIHKMCNKKMKSKISIKHNPRKAAAYKKKFKKIFGPVSE